MNKKKPRKPCEMCGEPVKKNAQKFCSWNCSAASRRLAQEQVWELSQEYTARDPRNVKRYLIKIRGHVCSICSNTEWTGQPIPLLLDHIDGNAENCKFSNLRLVCANCEAQLPTSKGKNRGNGRKWRREMRQKEKDAEVIQG